MIVYNDTIPQQFYNSKVSRIIIIYESGPISTWPMAAPSQAKFAVVL